MEIRAYIKNVKVSPKKLRFLIDAIKKMKPDSALDFLYYTNKKTARILYQALKSAIANANQIQNLDRESIKFKTIMIEEGQKLKRYRPGGRGGVKPFVRLHSHIKIILKASEKKIEDNKPKLSVKKVSNIKKNGTKSKS